MVQPELLLLVRGNGKQEMENRMKTAVQSTPVVLAIGNHRSFVSSASSESQPISPSENTFPQWLGTNQC